MTEQAEKVEAKALSNMDSTIQRLSEYLRYEAISCEKEHDKDVRALAERIRDDLAGLGMDNARLLELDGAHPAVAAEWMKAEGKPTVLIYGHLDLQPVAGEPWDTPPHESHVKDGRLYARGSADDMGGWVSHFAAVEAWMSEAGDLPCNIRFLIEGEEEIGSPNLEAYMDAYPEAFDADVMVLTDCENPSTEIPGLTISLRGLLEIEVRCQGLEGDVHSGLWGNAIPDSSIALIQLIHRLVDEDGRLKFGRVDVPASFAERAAEVPLDEETIRKGARLRPDVQPLPERGRTAAEWAWRQPSVTILSTTLPAPGREKNAVRAQASAKLSLRVAPGQTPDELFDIVAGALRDNPPQGVLVSVERLTSGESWLYEPKGPAFPAADRAYERAWGHRMVPIGVGGSIPFVAMFGKRFSDLPLILNGVMDPLTGAHGPNESMDLSVFAKTVRATVHLYDELSRAVPAAQ